MTGLTVTVALEGATAAFDKLWTYAVPPELHSAAKPGCRVLVPFGKGNSKRQGMIFALETGEISGLKKIVKVNDETPVLSEEMLGLCEYMRESVFCTYYDAVHAMLPAGLGLKLINYYSANEDFDGQPLSDTEAQVFEYLKNVGERAEDSILSELGVTKELLSEMAKRQALILTSDTKRKIGDATQKWVRITENIPEKLTVKQRLVVELLETAGAASIKEICYLTGVTSAVVEGLVKKGVLISFEKRVYRTPRNRVGAYKGETDLTEEQRTAFLGLKDLLDTDKGETALLFGVTGSGKTQVFLKLVEETCSRGKGVIVMVPEIALTPQLISLFSARFGKKVAVFHSAMSLGQRLDEWQRIKDGSALIAIGTRSAVFAPFKELGLIVIDEEQEHTYKSEKTPRFRTEKIAKYRTAYHKGLLCLASATPSMESWTKAIGGQYSLFKLTKRFGNAVLPEVETVDMKQELLSGNSGIISSRLYEAMRERLDKKEQIIILLNRRGHNTYVSCPSCGYVATCPNCSVSLTYHSANNRLMCHYCGHSEAVGGACPECKNEHMKFSGLGTQKAEEEIKLLFPEAKVLRLDADSTMTRDSFATYLGDFAKGEYDILIGTQMVAKGLDFPKVTLVGVLGADSAMYSEDYRSFERSFSLLTQVIGRAGRGDNPGLAIIQTSGNDNEMIELAEKQDYETFYSKEIMTRRLMVYPPYCDICVVTAQAIFENRAKAAIETVFNNIKELINGEFKGVKVIILGPSPSAVPRVNNRYRYRMMIKCKNTKEFRKMLRKAVDIKTEAGTTVSVDFNPET